MFEQNVRLFLNDRPFKINFIDFDYTLLLTTNKLNTENII